MKYYLKIRIIPGGIDIHFLYMQVITDKHVIITTKTYKIFPRTRN